MFWASFPDEVKAVIRLNKLLKIKVNHTAVNNELQNHPDYPSLLCISDSLKKWNVPNAAGKISPSEIGELPTPFLAVNPGTALPLMVVADVTNDIVRYYSGNFKIPVIENRNDFISRWQGLYLLAEPGLNAGEKDFYLNRRKTLTRQLLPLFLILLSISFTLYLLTKNISNYFGLNTIGLYIEYGCLLTGIGLSTLLLWYEMDRNNPLLHKMCTSITKGNCAAILTGKAAKVFSWLSWSEVGFFYFSGGLLAVIFFPANSITPVLALLALPYTIFSIYFQWKVAKQWCVLCLLVQVVLVGSAANVLIHELYLSPFPLSTTSLVKILGLYIFPVLAWFTIRPFLVQLQGAKTVRRRLSRLKFRPDVFHTLLQKQKSIKSPAQGLGIDIGNYAAQNTLIKVCNPLCTPCSKSHSKIKELLEACPDLKVKIIFNIPDKDGYPHFKPVSHFLVVAEEDNQPKIRKVLDDWYLSPARDYTIFTTVHPHPPEEKINEQRKKITAMFDWCMQQDIKGTPTFFLNGRQVPDAYGIEELRYFLSE
jgi:hypothetical protein